MLSILLMINIMIAVKDITCGALQSTRCSTQNCCYEQATITCCNGYILQIQNQTVASCVKCLTSGTSCYKTNQACCPGLRCGSGPVSYPEPRLTDKCISQLIVGWTYSSRRWKKTSQLLIVYYTGDFFDSKTHKYTPIPSYSSSLPTYLSRITFCGNNLDAAHHWSLKTFVIIVRQCSGYTIVSSSRKIFCFSEGWTSHTYSVPLFVSFLTCD